MPIPSIWNLENDFSRLFRSDLADRILEGNPTATRGNISWTLIGPTKYIGLLNSFIQFLHVCQVLTTPGFVFTVILHGHRLDSLQTPKSFLHHGPLFDIKHNSLETHGCFLNRKWSIYPVPTNLMIHDDRFHPAGLCSVLHDGHGQGPKMQDVLQLVGIVNRSVSLIRDLDFHFCAGP